MTLSEAAQEVAERILDSAQQDAPANPVRDELVLLSEAVAILSS